MEDGTITSGKRLEAPAVMVQLLHIALLLAQILPCVV